MHDSTQRDNRNIGGYVLCYSLWVVVLLLSLAVMAVWRVTIVDLIAVVIGDSYANRFLYQLAMLLLGIGAFILVIAAEAYLRMGVARRLVWRRFARLALPLAVAVAAGLLVQLVLQQM